MPDIENAVSNSVLCYISYARESFSDRQIVSVCEGFYKCDEIVSAKEVLYEYSEETLVRRRGDNRIAADLNDILSLFRKLDEDSVILPKFLSDGKRIPPTTGFEVITEHIIGLVSEINSLKSEITQLKNQKDQSLSAEFKSELIAIKKSLTDLSKGTSHSNPSNPNLHGARQLVPVSVEPSGSRFPRSEFRRTVSAGVAGSSTQNDEVTNATVESEPSSLGDSRSMGSSVPRNSASLASSANSSGEVRVPANLRGAAGRSDEGGDRHEDGADGEPSTEEWTLVNRRRNRTRAVIGTRTNASSLSGVQEFRDFFVGRCHPSATTESLVSYVAEELQVSVLRCFCISREESFTKSFKVTVLAEHSSKMLDETMWPRDVTVRRFFLGRRQNGSRY